LGLLARKLDREFVSRFTPEDAIAEMRRLEALVCLPEDATPNIRELPIVAAARESFSEFIISETGIACIPQIMTKKNRLCQHNMHGSLFYVHC
jgi:hypothetical protein